MASGEVSETPLYTSSSSVRKERTFPGLEDVKGHCVLTFGRASAGVHRGRFEILSIFFAEANERLPANRKIDINNTHSHSAI